MAKSMRQSYVTREQIDQAKQMDLLSYLQKYEPDELVRINLNTYSTRTHDSLKISNGKWCWWSQGVGGRSALDYLIKVRGMEFVEAVQHLCGCSGYTPSPPVYTVKPRPKPLFMLPKQYVNNDRVLRYLADRGMDSNILAYCVDTRRLYEDERHNCVYATKNKIQTNLVYPSNTEIYRKKIFGIYCHVIEPLVLHRRSQPSYHKEFSIF